MKDVYFTVGPGQLYPGLRKYYDEAFERGIPTISHRSAAFSELFRSTKRVLFKLLDVPASYHMFLTGSGLEAMERVVQNISGISSTHFVGGAFARKWAEFSHELGKKVTRIVVEDGCGFDLGDVSLPRTTESIYITINETSTGVYTDESFVRALRARHPKAFIAVDIVSAAPYVKLRFEDIDAALFSVQKGFGLPAGMGVIIVSPRAIRRSRAIAELGIQTGTYHSFTALEKMESKYQTPETPNVLALYLLNRVAADLQARGMYKIRKEIASRAHDAYSLFNSHPQLHPFVQNTQVRSPLTIVLQVPDNSSSVISKLARKGLIVSSGYGLYGNSHIRIANYPAHTDSGFHRLLNILARDVR